MRRVTANDPVWRKSGVGSTEVAAVVGCAFEADNTPLVQWAKCVQKLELPELKRMRKEHLEQGSSKWLTWRKGGVGGSEVACVVGANPYSNSKAPAIWSRKLPSDHPQAAPEQEDNPAMQYGRKNEPEARRTYESLMGWTATPVCVLHDDLNYVRCSLDGLSADGGIVLEIKCPKSDKNHQKSLEIAKIAGDFERQTAFSAAFVHYRYQVCYQLEITGAKVAHFVSFKPEWPDPGNRFCVYSLFPEPETQRFLLERVTEFWGFVERRESPPKEWCVPCWSHPTSLAIPDNPPTPA